MNKTLKPQILPMLFRSTPKFTLIWLVFAQIGFGFTLEAESVLEALREKMAAGLVSGSLYSEFITGLNETDGCDTWTRNANAFSHEVWIEIQETCPELLDQGQARSQVKETGPIQFYGSVMQSLQPRREIRPSPLLDGNVAGSYGKASFNLREYKPYERQLALTKNGFSLYAGHMTQALNPTRMDFISGKSFYAGWKGQSGLSGSLASSKAALEGLGVGFKAKDWEVQTAGAWNQLKPRTAELNPIRRDARFFHLGMARHNFKIQAIQNHFETPLGKPANGWIGGTAFLDPKKRGEIGLACSRWDWTDMEGLKQSRVGGYGQLSIGSRENYRLTLRQASQGWSNPLQSRPGSTHDTLADPWLLPGKGAGGLDLQSQFMIGRVGKYTAELKSGAQLTWILASGGPLTAEPRVAMVQHFGEWSYTCGTGFHFKKTSPPTTFSLSSVEPQGEEGNTSLGHILAWRGDAWQARLALTQQSVLYQGSYPAPLAFTLERERKKFNQGLLRLEALTADWRNPVRSFRISLRQDWFLGTRLVLQNSLRLPWTQNLGWANELGYQVGLVASL